MGEYPAVAGRATHNVAAANVFYLDHIGAAVAEHACTNGSRINGREISYFEALEWLGWHDMYGPLVTANYSARQIDILHQYCQFDEMYSGYSPVNFGSRFSPKALMASLKSFWLRA